MSQSTLLQNHDKFQNIFLFYASKMKHFNFQQLNFVYFVIEYCTVIKKFIEATLTTTYFQSKKCKDGISFIIFIPYNFFKMFTNVYYLSSANTRLRFYGFHFILHMSHSWRPWTWLDKNRRRTTMKPAKSHLTIAIY